MKTAQGAKDFFLTDALDFSKNNPIVGQRWDSNRFGTHLAGFKFKGSDFQDKNDKIYPFTDIGVSGSGMFFQKNGTYTIVDAFWDKKLKEVVNTENLQHKLILLAPHEGYRKQSANEWADLRRTSDIRASAIKYSDYKDPSKLGAFFRSRRTERKVTDDVRHEYETNVAINTALNKARKDDSDFEGESTSFYGTDEADYEIDIEMVDNDVNRMLNACRSDLSNPKNNIVFNQPMEGIELSMQLDGIEGLRLYDVFGCTGVPVKYFNTGIFGITAIKHSISNNDWVTDISAQFYPDASNI